MALWVPNASMEVRRAPSLDARIVGAAAGDEAHGLACMVVTVRDVKQWNPDKE